MAHKGKSTVKSGKMKHATGYKGSGYKTGGYNVRIHKPGSRRKG